MKSSNVRRFFTYILGVAVVVLGFAAAVHIPTPKPGGQLQNDVELQSDPNPAEFPTFAEMGLSFKPKMIEDPEGNQVMSFLQTSPMSTREAHDSVTLSNNVPKHVITGQVAGLVNNDPVTVILGTMFGSRFDILFEQKVTMESPVFTFQVPKGRYYIKVEGTGYRLPGVTLIRLPCRQARCRFSKKEDKLTVMEMGKEPGVYNYEWVLQRAAQYGVESLSVVAPTDASVINADKPGMESNLDYSDAAAKLKLNFGIELHGAWGSEYASRILGMLEKWKWFKQFHKSQPIKQKWLLTDRPLYPQDLAISHVENAPDNSQGGNLDWRERVSQTSTHKGHDDNDEYGQVVTISRHAFMFASRRAIENKMQRSVYFSRRLYKAIIRAMCLHSPFMMRSYFLNMHDVQILEPFELERMKRRGDNLSHYPSNHYQSWFEHPEELVEIATTWSEYPEGMQKITGLKYLLRRQDGMINPEEPTAPAIAYPRGSKTDSYIEFMESAFHKYDNIPNLIIHELGHFIDMNMTPANIRKMWEEVGGWHRYSNDPDGWTTHQQTEFVSAYAHKKNPSEDFASSIAEYVLNPKLLMSRAPKKYTFMRDQIMNGAYYVTKASHEFRVLNLGNPDFMYPGRIIAVKVKVTGQINEDKKVDFEIKLANNGPDSCATYARFRLTSSLGTFVDVSLPSYKCSHTLTGSITMNRAQKRGVWTTDQIELSDANRLHRFVGAADFGMRVWLDNGAEDFQVPQTIIPSIAISLIKGNDHATVRATWLVADDGVLRERSGAFAAINSNVTGQHSLGTYVNSAITTSSLRSDWRREIWTGYRKIPSHMCEVERSIRREPADDIVFNKFAFDEDNSFDGLTRRQTDANVYNCYQVSVNIPLSSAARSGDYYLTLIKSFDSAGNTQTLQWPVGEGPSVHYTSSVARPDNNLPEIRDISVESRPSNPDSPNGETIVTVSFQLRDAESGIASVSAIILDPFGARFIYYPLYKDVKEWQTISYRQVLPRGSIPGVWHLSEVRAEDNAGNELMARLNEQVLVTSA